MSAPVSLGSHAVSAEADEYEEVEVEVTDEEEEEEEDEVANQEQQPLPVPTPAPAPGTPAEAATSAPTAAEPAAPRPGAQPQRLLEEVRTQPSDAKQQAPTAEGAAPPAPQQQQQPGEGQPSDLAQLEEQAVKMAKEVQQVASYLASGLASALNTAATAATGPSTPHADGGAAAPAAATAALGVIGSSISSWWANIDKTMVGEEQPAAGAAAPGAAPTSRDIGVQLRAAFCLADEDVVVESFGCKLVQTYACATNGLTAPMQMTLAGKLHISQQAACFEATEHLAVSGKELLFKVSYCDLASASHEGARAGARACDVLRLSVRPGAKASGRCGGPAAAGAGGPLPGGPPARGASAGGGRGSGAGEADGEWSVAFQEFDGSGALDGALALIHHLSESLG